ncbi:MAG: hypothetical protein AAGI15_01955 [Pseudomonadota bacterium]
MDSNQVEQALDAFEAHYDYDATYMRHMNTHAPATFEKFSVLSELVQMRQAAPPNASYAAKLVGAMTEDCGPCVQLTVAMAQEGGVSAESIAAVLTRNVEAMDPETQLGYAFATAVVERATTREVLREQVRARWGDAGVVDLSIAVQIGRVFPMMKTALGFDLSCQRVSVGERIIEMAR